MASRSRSNHAPQQSPWQPPRERVRQRELKREAVILAAARAFKERGLHQTTIDDIAAFLHVTKPTIYYYLANKEQIIYECFRAGIGEITATLTALEASQACGRDKLLALLKRYAEVMASDFGWCMVRVEEQELGRALGAKIKQLKSQIDHGLRRLLAAGVADGSIRACDPKMTAFALAGAMNWIGHWYRAGEPLTPAEIAERFSELFVQGLRPAAAPSVPDATVKES
jgi:AcrR family transcriptional regulator